MFKIVSKTSTYLLFYKKILQIRTLVSASKGPDRILHAEKYTTTDPNVPVKLWQNRLEGSKIPPKSLWSMVQETVQRVPNRTALAVKRDGVWIKWTYAEYQKDIVTVAKAFIKLGLQPHHSVGILGHNAPEWHIANIASVIAGGLACGIYTTSSAAAVQYKAKHSRANIMVVEDEEQLAKVQNCQEELSDHLQCVVQYTGQVTSPGVLSWSQLLAIGRAESEDDLNQRLEQQAVNMACMIVYTSGTTDYPKGVLLSQDNITWIIQASQDNFCWTIDSETCVSYLPLSHIAAQIIDIYLCFFGGATVWFADKSALQGSLVETLREVRPTRFMAVPRVYEKMQEKLLEIGKQNHGFKKKLSDWAKSQAFEHHQRKMKGLNTFSLQYLLASKLILSQVHKGLGLDRAAHPTLGGLFSGASPLPIHTFNYFLSLDLPIMELLGSSETCGPQSLSLPGPGTKPGSVGRCFPHFETKIDNPDEFGVGEIVTRGRNNCMGYLWDSTNTEKLIDKEGWIHSGDLGRRDEDGFFYVTGRSKEIVITAGGENIAPVPIEEAIKAEMRDIVSNVMLVGDHRKYLSVLITLKTELDQMCSPTNDLHPSVIDWLRERNCNAETLKQVSETYGEEVSRDIMEAIKKANEAAQSRAHRVQKFTLLPADFSIQTGELTPTLKVKRHLVLKKYEEYVDKMYE